jgi:hypothetical protein
MTSLLLTALIVLGAPPAADSAPYPDDSYSRPQVDRWSSFETLTGVQPPGNPVQRMADYELNELRAVTRDGKPWARWRFICRPNKGAVLCFSTAFRHLPSTVTVRCFNGGTKPATFAMSTPEVPWSPDASHPYFNWSVMGDAPVPPGEERVVRFDLTRLGADKAVPGQKPVPPISVNLHSAGPEAGVEYRLDLREWTVLYPDAPGVKVSSLTAPKRLAPGSDATFSIEATGVSPEAAVDLEVRDDPHVLWRIRLDADQRRALAETGRCQLHAKTPWYLPGSKLTVGLVVDGYRAAGVEPTMIVADSAQPGFAVAQRRDYHGRPTAFVNGKPFTWSGYSSYDYSPGNVNDFGSAGADLFVVPVAAGRHVHQVSAPTWVAPDRYDFSEVDERVCMSLQANPDAFLILRASLALPMFWMQEHPDAIAKVRTPQGDVAWEETGTLAASIASDDWRKQQAVCLRALIDHCAHQPWASRVIGFMPTAEVTEEWFAWGCNDGFYADYSPANEAGFARWCEARGYPWRKIPDPEVQQRPGSDYYPVDDAGKRSAAYAQYSSDLSADTIDYFGKVVKDATGGRSLVGVFYAYLIQLAGEPRQHTSGQFGLRRVLDSPNVDFLAGVPLFYSRDLTNGGDILGATTQSIARAGKLYVNEDDLFSWLHNSLWHTLYDPADPRGADISMHRRCLAEDMVYGVNAHWFSLFSSWHHDAALMEELGRQMKLQSSAPTFDRTPTEETAFVVDDTSFAWFPPETKHPNATNIRLLLALGRTGAPVGIWYLRDLDKLPDRIKLVVIAEATAAAPDDLAKLRSLLAKGGRTVLVLGRPGAIDPIAQKSNPEAPSTLLSLTLPAGDGNLERPLPNGGRLLWFAQPPLDSVQARGWMEQAGVHMYAPINFVVHASRGLVALTAAVAGDFELSFPKAVRVRDLFDGWTAEGAKLTCPFAAGQTRLLAVEER